MSKFLTRCVLAISDNYDDGQWVLVEPLIYQSDVAGITITVPVGFQTDLASVPRLPIVYLLCGDTSSAAAVVHDYIYQAHPVNRKMADAIFLEASAITGVPAWRRFAMWAGIRLFGASHWGPDTPATTEKVTP